MKRLVIFYFFFVFSFPNKLVVRKLNIGASPRRTIDSSGRKRGGKEGRMTGLFSSLGRRRRLVFVNLGGRMGWEGTATWGVVNRWDDDDDGANWRRHQRNSQSNWTLSRCLTHELTPLYQD
ncbi:hypothetical protein BGZ63DRAFT_68357 [Mariannaea sp. PMI_226]|nr:hypothetical protein BGZ63DRAFT_68357 [Mariannaea sp. PMI_226]